MKIRILFSLAIGLLSLFWITAKWYVVADYYEYGTCDFVLSGFPLPFCVDWGIISRFGNSFDTALNYTNLMVDILFYTGIPFGLTFLSGKPFKEPSKVLRASTWVLVCFACLHTAYVFWLMTIGDLYPWFDKGYDIQAVEFLNADNIYKNMRPQ